MIGMTEIYRAVMLISFAVYLVYGVFSLTAKFPSKPIFDRYNKSRKIFGIVMLGGSLYALLHVLFDLRMSHVIAARSINISCFYFGCLFLEIAFSTLLSEKYKARKNILIAGIKCSLMTLLLAVNLILVPYEYKQLVVLIAAVVFAVGCALSVIRYHILYKRTLANYDNFYSDDLGNFVSWSCIGIYGITFMGLLGGLVNGMSLIYFTIALAMGLLFLSYMFVSYHNYLINVGFAEVVLPSETIIAVNPDPEFDEDYDSVRGNTIPQMHYDRLDNLVDAWVAGLGYTQKSITVEALARELNTNRTYLSTFINQRYNMTFREWITKLRIDHSERLLIDQPCMSISEIAESIGYSPSSFTKIFSKYNNIPPNQWRSKQYRAS